MSKRDFTFLVVGAVLAYGVFVFLSAEAPEVPSEPTVAEIDSERMKLEADQAYLMSEIDVHPGLSVYLPCYGVPECRALQVEWQKLEAQRMALLQERVQAQMRERE